MLIPMTRDQRMAFLDWRNPQYDGPFSCINETGRRLTWLPTLGIFDSCDVPQHIIREWTVPAWDRSAVTL